MQLRPVFVFGEDGSPKLSFQVAAQKPGVDGVYRLVDPLLAHHLRQTARSS